MGETQIPSPSSVATPRPGSVLSCLRLCGRLRGSGRTRCQGRQAPCPPPPWLPARYPPHLFSSPYLEQCCRANVGCASLPLCPSPSHTSAPSRPSASSSGGCCQRRSHL